MAYGTFMSMKDIKKEFAIKSTATMMRFVHREQIPYIKESAKIILFQTVEVMKVLEKFKRNTCRYY
jgi:hypothetical protein